MKSVFGIILIGIVAHIIVHTQAQGRGQLPPPPPYQGGGAREWLGSGPIFGFEPPSVKHPWMGGGLGSGGGNGGWGGSWWDGNGPLGGGGWGGWGGWGSGLHDPIGWYPSDTGKKGDIWSNPDGGPDLSVKCWKETETGGYNQCVCRYYYSNIIHKPPTGAMVEGECEISGGHRGGVQEGYSSVGSPCTAKAR